MIWHGIFIGITCFVRFITKVVFDNCYLCVIYHAVITYTDSLIMDINAPRVRHRALTGYLRRNWKGDSWLLKRIVYNMDVSPYLGALPPELRKCLGGENIATVTAQFRENLDDFLIKNAFELRNLESDVVYELPQIGALFGVRCNLLARGINSYGVNPWSGLLGFVCKLSFPEINAHYALKLYYDNGMGVTYLRHGPWFEAAAALAANKAESRDNVPMYMASLKYEKYLLSKWAGDSDDGMNARENEYKIFVTHKDEEEARNLRNGRRIDWGELYRTNYGAMSYPARKLYRQIMQMDTWAVIQGLQNARNNFQCRDAQCALELAGLVAWYDDNSALAEFIDKIQRQR